MSLRHRIRELRELHDLNQRELASKLGVNPSAVALWELGQRKPSMDNVIKLAEIFDLTVTELIGV